MNQSTEIALRLATAGDTAKIWDIIRQAIERRRQDGSQQWQNGYPNPVVIADDIAQKHGYILTVNHEVAVYGALIFNYEPAYGDIDGQWLSDGLFLVVHRVAVDSKFHGQGLVKEFFQRAEDFAIAHDTYSIKVDTNYDNAAMLHILQKLSYTYCGEVMLSGGPRKAFEKILSEPAPQSSLNF